MKKVFILDTNVLLSNPLCIYKFDDNDVVIPISVIEEVDTFKKDMSDIGRNAREVSRILDKLRDRGTLSSGISIFEDRDDSGQLFVYLGHNMEILPELLADSTDNHILAIALTLQKQFGDSRRVSVITKDTNLRIKADAFGLVAEDFAADKVDISHFYTGVTYITVTPEVINNFYAQREVRLDEYNLYPNQFVVLEDESDTSQKVFGIFDGDQKVVKMIEPRTEGVWGIYSRNLEQAMALEVLLDDKIRLVTISGEAGTGKTLMAIAAGLTKTTDEDQYQKLLVSRPIFPLGRDIGYLPGDLDEKLNPWMQPIFDNLELLLGGGSSSRSKRLSKSYEELINQGMLAIEPLTYIRGRSLPSQYFVVDEAQNLTPHEIKTILTRAGEGTKIVLTGDPYQIDNPYIDSQSNGLTYVIERFRTEAIAGHITLKRGERSQLASKAAKLL
ncbi:PhoH family protein [Pseudobacteriovorax antillogorgiicola]|uniref:PhoH-like ATPase n=1 Tax=Pseudobacteriovorax antillogorgiicola TaxID=1513793 RepID=A0A1Y6BDQ0_9BACT|nr:PhoH family protein [Pseudobacteriovorax antillogorgiicola]TCS58670.1 PhoH-like ATPase [Pseudobacteriovorax antillogorgiicola]SME96100.1 PhoH-like ATPase [Pseudobacteriovorax antillogorgiicola]